MEHKFTEDKSYYAILNVPRSASVADIKKSYYKLSLQYHPDKIHDLSMKEEGKRIFQVLAKAYATLSNPEEREFYDKNGISKTNFDDLSPDEQFDIILEEMSKSRFSARDIDSFLENEQMKGKARGEGVLISEMEEKELRESYLKYEGSMKLIMECVVGSTNKDKPRFEKYLGDLIDKGELPLLKKFEVVKLKKLKKKKCGVKSSPTNRKGKGVRKSRKGNPVFPPRSRRE